MSKGNIKTDSFTDNQIIDGLLERLVPANDAEKEHLESGARRIIKRLDKATNWDKVKSKLTTRQLLYVFEDEE